MGPSFRTGSQPEAGVLLGRGLDLVEGGVEEVGELALERGAGPVLLLVGSTSRSKRWWSSTQPRPTQNGSRSPGSKGWRMTGHVGARHEVEPGPAVGPGQAGRRRSCSGIVDQRFDHIASGKFDSTAPRAYLRVPSVTCTQLP